jgi:Protein of unknown function (DUF998)
MSEARDDAVTGRDQPIMSTRSQTRSGRSTGDGSTRVLLAAGVVAGPLFIAVAAAQAITRDGFDLRRHPLSLLSLGDLGWIQIGNFIVSGLLSVAFAVGMRRVLHPGRAGTWGPLLVGIFGLGLVIGGAFVTDPDLGFPPGVPSETKPSWHGMVHDIGPGVAFDALLLACLVLMRRFLGLRLRAWAAYCAATAIALLLLTWWPSTAGISLRLAVAIVVAFGWMTALAVHLRGEQTAQLEPADHRGES